MSDEEKPEKQPKLLGADARLLNMIIDCVSVLIQQSNAIRELTNVPSLDRDVRNKVSEQLTSSADKLEEILETAKVLLAPYQKGAGDGR